MWVQITEFDSPGMKRDEYDRWCVENIDVIADIPGVVAKLFCADVASDRRVGVYTFTDRDACDAYLRSELHQSAIVQNPAITNIRSNGIDLLEAPTNALNEALASVSSSVR